MSVEKKNVPGYISLIFIAAYCTFLLVLAVLSAKDHKKAKTDYYTHHFGRLSNSKEIQDAYREKDKENQSFKRNRFYLNDDGRFEKFPVSQ